MGERDKGWIMRWRALCGMKAGKRWDRESFSSSRLTVASPTRGQGSRLRSPYRVLNDVGRMGSPRVILHLRERERERERERHTVRHRE